MGDTGSQCPASYSPVEGLHSKELTFLISPASLVTLCMSLFSGFLAQGGSRLLRLTDVCSNNKMPEAKDFSTALASVGDSTLDNVDQSHSLPKNLKSWLHVLK